MGDYEVVLPCIGGQSKESGGKRPLQRTDSLPLELEAKTRQNRPNHLDLTPEADSKSTLDSGARIPAKAHEQLHRLTASADKDEALSSPDRTLKGLRRSEGTDFSASLGRTRKDAARSPNAGVEDDEHLKSRDQDETYDSDDSLDEEYAKSAIDDQAVGAHAVAHFGASSDWSPATDLSPIEDVSPTIELEAEADWLAYQPHTRRQPTTSASVFEEINNNSAPSCKVFDSASERPSAPPGAAAPGQKGVPCLESQSTTESGYESQSMGRVSDMISFFDRKSLDESKRAYDRDGAWADPCDASSAGGGSAEDVQFGVEADDNVPYVPEGVTFNIYAGRDMFRALPTGDTTPSAKSQPPTSHRGSPCAGGRAEDVRSSTSQRAGNVDEAAIAASLTLAGAGTIDKTISVAAGGGARKTGSAFSTPARVHAYDGLKRVEDVRLRSSGPDDCGLQDSAKSPNRCLPQGCADQDNRGHGGGRPRNASGQGAATTAPSDSGRRPPIPLPRLSKLRSLDSDEAPSVESEEEIVEIKFEAGDVATITRMQSKCNKDQLLKTRSAGEINTRSAPPATSSSSSLSHRDYQQFAQHVELLRRREADEKEIALDLERKLDEIRKLEERQRAVLQRTLMKVVKSARESSQPPAAVHSLASDSPRATGRTLTPAAAGSAPRLSPQSPRKANRSGARPEPGLKFSPISENGDYSFRDWGAESPALQRRTQSNHSLLSGDGGESPAFGGDGGGRDFLLAGSCSSLRSAAAADGQLSSDLLLSRYRLSSSYTELQQQTRESPERSGYFSDRECERRKAPGGSAAATKDADGGELQMAFLQSEIEKRQRQLEENIRLRDELQQLCRLAVLPHEDYERARDLYQDHVSHSRSYFLYPGDGGGSAAPPTTTAAATTRSHIDRVDADLSDMSWREEAATPLSSSRQSVNSERESLSLKRRAVDEGVKRPDALGSPAAPAPDLRSPTGSRPTSVCSDAMRPARGGSETAEETSTGTETQQAAEDVALNSSQHPSEKSETKSSPSKDCIVKVKKWSFPTKRILVTPKQDKGPCIEISGGLPIQEDGTGADRSGAFVKNILSDSIESQLHGELKKGDEVLEWNGICLRDQPDQYVQDIVSSFSSEIEMVVKEAAVRSNTKATSSMRKQTSLECDPSKIPSSNGTIGQRRADSAEPISLEAKVTRADSRTGSTNSAKSAQSLPTVSEKSATANAAHTARKDPTEGAPGRTESAKAAAKPSPNTDAKILVKGDPKERTKLPTNIESVLDRKPTSSLPCVAGTGLAAASAAEKAMAHQPTTKIGNGGVAIGENALAIQPATKVSNGVAAGFGAAEASHGHKVSAPPERSLPPTPHTDRKPVLAKKPIDCGDVQASFLYDKGRQLLTTRIESASNLAIIGKDVVNPFVKIHFIKNERIEEKRCTRYMDKDNNPAWKQFFTFTVSESDLPQYKVRLSAWDYHMPKQNLFIGSAMVHFADTTVLDGSLRLYKLESGPSERRRLESARTSPTTPSATPGTHAHTVRFASEPGATRQRTAATSRD